MLSVFAVALAVLAPTTGHAQAQTFTLRVNGFVDGTGKVTSSPAGISCTTAKYNPVGPCSATFAAGTVVTLTAVPGEQNTFGGWSGGACTGTGDCQVTVHQDNIEVRPNFIATRYQVTIVGAGNGTGTIHEPLGGAFGQPPIICTIRNGEAVDSRCTTTVAYNSVVQLEFETNVAGTNVLRAYSSACSIQAPGPCNAVIRFPTTITATIVAMELRVKSAGGTGTGTVTSTTGNAQINCTITSAAATGVCGKIYGSDTPGLVTLIPTPAEGSRFVGWSGACTSDPCTILADFPPNVPEALARFEALPENTVKLVVNGIGGFGRGRVTSSPAGIDCDFSNPESTAGTGTCLGIFPVGATVVLTAAPRDGTKVLGFTGACESPAATCNVLMYHDRTATVQLDPARFPVTIVASGGGSGRVTGLGSAEVPALSCTITRGVVAATGCASMYPFGSVALLGTATIGNTKFVGYGVPPCTTSTDCSVTVTGPLTISANFAAPEIDVTGAGTGSGRVSDVAGGGLDCRITPSGTTKTCWQTLDPESDQAITVRAQPENGSAFVGWSGLCTGTATTCATGGGFPPNAQLVAHFELVAATLTLAVRTTGHGSGTIQSSPAGIACVSTGGSPSGTCSAPLEAGATYTLSATPAAGSRFVEWGGDCTGAGTCTLTMSQTRSVSAQFELADANPIALTVVGAGTGRGIVTVAPGSTQCTFNGVVAGDPCSVSYAQPTQVTLTASAQFGSTFGGWTGDACSSTELTCTFALSASTTVSVSFISPHSPHDLGLALTGGFTLAPNERKALDRLGNGNGVYDLGDLLAYLDRTGQKLSAADAARVMQTPRTPAGPAPTTRRVP